MKKTLSKILILSLALLMALSMAGCYLFFSEEPEDVPETFTYTLLPDSGDLADNVDFNSPTENGSFNRLAAINAVARSVVAISIQNSVGTSYGSGVIVDIDASGKTSDQFYILTCHHVISGEGNITVSVPDKNSRNTGDENYDKNFEFTGTIDNNKSMHAGSEITLVGGDKDSDVAVLMLDLKGNENVKAEDIVACQIPKDDYVIQLGEDVFAVGNPSGMLPMTVSNGIISYIDRLVTVGSVGDMNLLQIDVQINHGNSGGALFNYYGQLVGITNAGSDEYDGLNYAIPYKNTTNVKEDQGFVTIAKQLIATKTDSNYGYISGRWMLGVTVKEEALENGGVRLKVEEVIKNGNAEESGMLAGDIITKITYKNADGETKMDDITTSAGLSAALSEIKKAYKIGDSFSMTLARIENGQYVSKTIDFKLQVEYIFCDTGERPKV
ncbi:MAG: trypsin-like peptidase domain-containing protein [Clostridia bacterium]|nr:trypsin-like peptidase domain-containing protein [Clostridia bacterium]